MFYNPQSTSASISSSLPTLLTTVSQSSSLLQQPAANGLGGQQAAGFPGVSPYAGAGQYPGFGGFPMQQPYPQQPYLQQPYPGQVPGAFPPGRIVTSYTQTVQRAFIPAPPYPGVPGQQPVPFQPGFGTRWF